MGFIPLQAFKRHTVFFILGKLSEMKLYVYILLNNPLRGIVSVTC